jgi:branched-chain amino acid transport system permease protein
VKQTLATLVGITEPVAPPDESWRLVILGVLTVLMMAFRPEGLITRTMMERLQFRRSPSRAAAEVSA